MHTQRESTYVELCLRDNRALIAVVAETVALPDGLSSGSKVLKELVVDGLLHEDTRARRTHLPAVVAIKWSY